MMEKFAGEGLMSWRPRPVPNGTNVDGVCCSYVDFSGRTSYAPAIGA